MNDRDLPATVLRLPMVYGPGDPLHRLYPVVKRIADKRRHIIFPRNPGRVALTARLRRKCCRSDCAGCCG